MPNRTLRRACGVAALCVAALAGPPASADEAPVASLSDGRSGKIYYESVTPSGYFALIKRDAPKTVVFGTLRLPDSPAGRVPAVIVAHGSAGVTDDREFWWAKQLAGSGVAAFVVDSFTPRNIRSTATDQAQLSTAANLADALAALKLLATHPRIDPERIGVMGFSKGGMVAMHAALEPFRRAVVGDGPRFAAHVPLYPACSDRMVTERVSGGPMLSLLGGRDDYTPAEPCRKYAGWLASKGVATKVVVYPDAYHGFDASGTPQIARDVLTGRNCDAQFDLDKFRITVRSTGQDITATARDYFKSCFTRGAMFGGDGEAKRKAPDEVKSFSKAAFKL
jgi:dienelactone hydrolase